MASALSSPYLSPSLSSSWQDLELTELRRMRQVVLEPLRPSLEEALIRLIKHRLHHLLPYPRPQHEFPERLNAPDIALLHPQRPLHRIAVLQHTLVRLCVFQREGEGASEHKLQAHDRGGWDADVGDGVVLRLGDQGDAEKGGEAGEVEGVVGLAGEGPLRDVWQQSAR